jgi:hypothetical protein
MELGWREGSYVTSRLARPFRKAYNPLTLPHRRLLYTDPLEFFKERIWIWNRFDGWSAASVYCSTRPNSLKVVFAGFMCALSCLRKWCWWWESRHTSWDQFYLWALSYDVSSSTQERWPGFNMASVSIRNGIEWRWWQYSLGTGTFSSWSDWLSASVLDKSD